MRPYIAIIKDSFREAVASRVLWLVLAMIVLLLALVAPLGYRINLTGEFSWGDIQEWPQLVEKLRLAAEADVPSPGKRIWEQIDEPTRTKLIQMRRIKEGDEGDYFQGSEVLRKALNELVKSRDLYHEPDWQGVSLPKEARDLLGRPRSELTGEQFARLNRLLIESFSRAHFRSRGASTSVSYLWYKSEPMPFTKEQVDSFAKEIVLTTAMGWIVGVFGMITAVLVTSTIIPQMFDPGSINLLLSKPISRSLLFVTKFLGGCAFILLNVTLLIGGLWLIAGLRFGIWNEGMLWCIPLFLFMFLIYYAVSALTGLIWKSAVISVVITVAFWLTCFLVDMGSFWTNSLAIEPRRISRLVAADEALVVVNEAGQMLAWDEEASEWRIVFEPRGGGGIPTLDGPFYHDETKQLLVGQGFSNPFGIVGRRITLRVARASDGWTLRDGPALPSGSAALVVDHKGAVLAAAADNVFQLQGPPAAVGEPVEIFGMRVPFTGRSAEFRPAVADRTHEFPDPLAAAADPLLPRLVLTSGNHVYLLERRSDGQYAEKAVAHLTGKESEGAAVAVAGKLAVVAREDGNVWVLASSDLSVKETRKLESNTQPRFVLAAPDGTQFAILFQNGKLWLVDALTGEFRLAPIGSQGEVSGAAFAAGRMLVGDYANRVVSYDSKTFAQIKVYRPALSRAEAGYYYFLKPLHAISPKPRHLGNTVQYVLTGKRTTDLGLFAGNLAQRRDDLHPWRPVVSGLVFVASMLLVSCLYLEWHEF